MRSYPRNEQNGRLLPFLRMGDHKIFLNFESQKKAITKYVNFPLKINCCQNKYWISKPD